MNLEQKTLQELITLLNRWGNYSLLINDKCIIFNNGIAFAKVDYAIAKMLIINRIKKELK